jgi:hypothetical protein
MKNSSGVARWVVTIASCLLVFARAVPIAAPPPFSLDKVAANLQRLADQVPDEEWHDRLVSHSSGCNCADEDDSPYAEEASADVADEDFQVAPPTDASPMEAPTYAVGLLQRSVSGHKLVDRHRSGCKCGAKKQAASSKALALASSSTAVSSAAAVSSGGDGDAKPTGIWVYTCKYSQPDLVFWRLTNTAYLRGGIVLKETIAYTDTCKMCDYNNVGCNKEEVELTDGNCLCMWRMNGVEMQTQLMSCSACVTDCIGAYRTFDLGKTEPGMQKGVCLRKKPHQTFADLAPVGYDAR